MPMKFLQLMETLLYGTLILSLSSDAMLFAEEITEEGSSSIVSEAIAPIFSTINDFMPTWSTEVQAHSETDSSDLDTEITPELVPEPPKDTEPDSPEEESPPEEESTPEETPPSSTSFGYGDPVVESQAVSAEFFKTAAFIGDSRSKGLMSFGGIQGQDLTAEALSVYNLWEKEISTPFGTMTLPEALTKQRYENIYIALGINSVGYPSREKFVNLYSQLVDEVRSSNPFANIYLQSIIPVNEPILHGKGTGDYINNTVIQEFNQLIQGIAKDKQVHYLDLFNHFVDETGQLPASASTDGLHFGSEYSKMWSYYLHTHTVY